MNLLAIDPGCTESAYVVWDGHLQDFGKVSNAVLLERIRETLRSQTDTCVIEMIGHYGTGMPAGKTVFDTCVYLGRFGERYGWNRVELILRPTVKAHICGNAKANDSNIRQALIDRFGGPECVKGYRKAIPKKGITERPRGALYGVASDVWSALAVAVTAWDQRIRAVEEP